MPEGHSPLGGSGAYRWMPGTCPGSARMSQGVSDESPDSEYSVPGTAAHALAAYCLNIGNEFDAWQMIGAWMYDGKVVPDGPSPEDMEDPAKVVFVDKDMADAVQVYLDAVRQAHPDRNQGNTWVERPFYCPTVHKMAWGQSDLTHLNGMGVLHVWDYKHGIGIVVEVEHNPQLMYYAVGMLTDLMMWDDVSQVVLHVAQPRGFHFDGPIREWSISVADLATWRDEMLRPAMETAHWLSDGANITRDDIMAMGLIKSGEHCRFCPARFAACPRQEADMIEMEELMSKMDKADGAPKLVAKDIGRFLTLFEVAKIKQKAAREVGYTRAQGGNPIPGWKLVKAKTNREWKDKAKAAAIKLFGKKDAMSAPKLASPAQLDKLPGGKGFTAEHAFKPEGGLRLVPEGDNRPEAGPKARAAFKPVKKK